MIKVGNNNIGSIYKGNTAIAKVYKGSELVYEKKIITPMPVALYDKQLNKIVQTNNIGGKSINRYEPIGVVVIPTSHNVYGTGECGVMALMSASLNTPDTGETSNVHISCGNNKDYADLSNFNKIVRMGTTDNDISDSIDGLSIYGCIPLMRNGMKSKLECPHDTKAKYYDYSNSSFGYIPSPYLNDGSRNPDYYTTNSPSSIYNALSDFNGKSNTEFLCSKVTAQPNWKTDSIIEDSNDEGYHPADCCCWRFHTIGTNQGDWYLPACGELGYIAPRYDMINDIISTIQTRFGKTFCPVLNSIYFSNSEYNYGTNRTIDFFNGIVSMGTRSAGGYVHPFLRAKLDVIN